MSRYLLLVILAACAKGEPPEDPACRADALEPDVAFAGPLAGPGVDSQGALRAPAMGTRYALSSTYLKLPRTEAAQQRFQGLMAPISMALTNQAGLVAMQLAFSERCGTARTLTVWENEAAMYRFVSSPAHGDAMSAVSEVSRGGSIALSWQGTDRDATWDAATQQLGAHTGAEY